MIYTFRCLKCGKEFEKEMTFRQYTHRYKHQCIICKSKNTIRIIQPSVVIFKGDGFTKSNIGGSEE